jgi:hypothetical protein
MKKMRLVIAAILFLSMVGAGLAIRHSSQIQLADGGSSSGGGSGGSSSGGGSGGH